MKVHSEKINILSRLLRENAITKEEALMLLIDESIQEDVEINIKDDVITIDKQLA